MIVATRYTGRSAVAGGTRDTHVAFATNTLRETTYFEGDVLQPLALREALAALYQVVVSDAKYRPKDRTQFLAWVAEQDHKFLATLGARSAEARKRLVELFARREELDSLERVRLAPFHRASREFFEHIWQNQYELELLLDPVITVHPDEISFEAFSRDESAYARVALSHDLFGRVGSLECGVTNIDFSLRLSDQFERLRSYRQTRLTIDPEGFGVASDGATAIREKKIDLPDSWLQGFLQVHATMSMSLTHVRLAPVDLFNVLRHLRRQKARTSLRSLRFELTPGEPGRIVLEPWNHVVPITAPWTYDGPKPTTIRVWGRDRLRPLARLLPNCQGVDVFLAGYGLPSFYLLDLGPVRFTLALSGWTDNDWTGGASFDLLTRRAPVTAGEVVRVYETLRNTRRAVEHDLSKRTGLTVDKCRSAMSHLCQGGRAMVDLAGGVYRHRDLLWEPFTLQAATALVRDTTEDRSPAAKAARTIFQRGDARLTARRPVTTGFKISGSVKGAGGRRVRPVLHLDHDGRIIEATCTCEQFRQAKLTQGPCEHMLALRLAHQDK